MVWPIHGYKSQVTIKPAPTMVQMQSPGPGIQTACHPFAEVTGRTPTVTAPARGRLDPLGELGVPISKDEAKLHPRWSKETLVNYLPFTTFQILTGGWQVIPMPKDFKSILKLPTPCSLEPRPLGGGREERCQTFNKMKHSDGPARAS